MPDLVLSTADEAMLGGESGPAAAMAMRIVTGVARASGAAALLDITNAHIDGCLYHGQAGLDLANRFVELGGRVTVRTTLNVSSLDLLHPELIKLGETDARKSRALMDAYVEMGCVPTWTCAPYQLAERPAFGDHIAWAESNAIVFANSVLGARTDRYGDFIDIAAAITGRTPAAGLHLDQNRRAEVVYDVSGLSSALRARDVFFPVLGHLIGGDAGTAVPAVIGLDAASEDQMKALGAAAASSGPVGLVHVVGVTPEAPTLAAAVGDGVVRRRVEVTPTTIRRERDRLTYRTSEGPLETVNLGTPHYSVAQLTRLVELMNGRSVHPSVALYVNTGRDALADSGAADSLADLGVRVVTDTCTYVTAILDDAATSMTDSAKWAHYAPGNIGSDVIFASMEECIDSAIAGRVVHHDGVWA